MLAAFPPVLYFFIRDTVIVVTIFSRLYITKMYLFNNEIYYLSNVGELGFECDAEIVSNPSTSFGLVCDSLLNVLRLRPWK